MFTYHRVLRWHKGRSSVLKCVTFLIVCAIGYRVLVSRRDSLVEYYEDSGRFYRSDNSPVILKNIPGGPREVTSKGWDTEKGYRLRKDHLIAACVALNPSLYKGQNSENNLRSHLFVDRKRNLLYCGMEKVGSTFWKRIFQIITGIRSERNPYDIPANSAHDGRLETFQKLSFSEIVEMVRSYKKFLFVRNPYSRLFSCYVDKLFSPNVAYFNLRHTVATISRGGKFQSTTKCPPNVTFREFVKFVIYSLRNGKHLDVHFMPMYDHCRPCQIRYDIIGKMENFAEDTEYILKSQKLNTAIDVNMTKRAKVVDTIGDYVAHLYRDRQGTDKCFPFTTAIKLYWRTVQIQGIIDKNIDFPDIKFLSDNQLEKNKVMEAFMLASQQSDPVKLKANRREALMEAYRQVPEEELEELRFLFRPDFELFGYDTNLNLFQNKDTNSSFSYFHLDKTV